MVREAVEGDVPFIVELAEEAHRASSWADLVPFCAESIAGSCRHLMAREDAVVLITDRGSIWLVRHALYFNHAEPFVSDVFFYATKGGDALRRAAERWAGPGVVALSRNAATDPRLDRLYARAGYQPVEHQFARRQA